MPPQLRRQQSIRWLIDLKAISSFGGGRSELGDPTESDEGDDFERSYGIHGREDSRSSSSSDHIDDVYDPLRSPTMLDSDEVDGVGIEELEARLAEFERELEAMARPLALAGARLQRAQDGEDGLSVEAVEAEIASMNASMRELRDEAARLTLRGDIHDAVRRRQADDASRRRELEKPGGELQSAELKVEDTRQQLEADEEEFEARREAATRTKIDRDTAIGAIDDLRPRLVASQEAAATLEAAEEALRAARAAYSDADGRALVSQNRMGDLAAGHVPLEDAREVIEAYDTALIDLRTSRIEIERLEGVVREARRGRDIAGRRLTDDLKAWLRSKQRLGDPQALAVRDTVQAHHTASTTLERQETIVDERRTELATDEATLASARDEAKRLEKRSQVLSLGEQLSALLHSKALTGVSIWAGDGAVTVRDKLGPDPYDRFVSFSTRFTADLERLVQLGMPADAVAAMYRDDLQWPELWWPPSMREQERNWVEVNAFLDQMNPTKKGRSITEKIGGTVQEHQATPGRHTDEMLKSSLLASKSKSEEVGRWVGAFSIALSLQKVWQSLGASKAEDIKDPIELLLAIDQQLDARSDAVQHTLGAARTALTLDLLKEVASLAPAVGSVDSLCSACIEAHHAITWWQSATRDTLAVQQAVESDSRVAAAASHIQKRSKQLAIRASSSAAGAVLSMVGFLCAATGVAAPAALVFHGAGVVVKSGTRAVSTLFDWRRADEALAVLNDARAGDADARKLLFATHGRYACALVALMAKEGDPIALSIFNHHGVDAAAVQKAFPGLLKRFLMTTLKEKDKPKGWDHQVKKLQKIGAAVPGMLSGGAEFLALRGTALSGLADGWLSEKRRVQTQLAMLAFSTQTDDYVRRGMEQLLEWRDGMETLDDELSDLRFEGKADTDAYRARQKLLVTLRSQYNESIVKSRELRDTIAAQLKQALELMETLMASPEGIDEEARGRFLAIVQQDQATLAYLAFVH